MITLYDFVAKLYPEIKPDRSGILFGLEFLSVSGRSFYDTIVVRDVNIEAEKLVFSEIRKDGTISPISSTWKYNIGWFVCGYHLMSTTERASSRIVNNVDRIFSIRLVHNDIRKIKRENFPNELPKDEVLFFPD